MPMRHYVDLHGIGSVSRVKPCQSGQSQLKRKCGIQVEILDKRLLTNLKVY